MELRIEGIIFLITAWLCVIGLVIYCFRNVIRSDKSNLSNSGSR